MSLYYIVDGYNVIHSYRDRFPGSIEMARDKLLSQISVKRPQGSSRNRIKVIFDGQAGVTGPSQSGIDVAFTSGSEADDLIRKLVASDRNPKQIVVVTDDRAIIRDVSVKGASVMPTAEFLGKLFDAKRRKRKFQHPESGFEPRQITDINKELEELWVKKKKPPK